MDSMRERESKYPSSKMGGVVVSNAGDYRAVLSRAGKAKALTSDHHASISKILLLWFMSKRFFHCDQPSHAYEK